VLQIIVGGCLELKRAGTASASSSIVIQLLPSVANGRTFNSFPAMEFLADFEEIEHWTTQVSLKRLQAAYASENTAPHS
jgi:hypothetical protein